MEAKLNYVDMGLLLTPFLSPSHLVVNSPLIVPIETCHSLIGPMCAKITSFFSILWVHLSLSP
jgi:hypothetical protein